ncbi:MAG: hypothetical protein ABIJ08_00900 [Nanoarchaeota archaeon]
MDNAKEQMVGWIIQFIKNRDLLYKRLLSVNRDTNSFDIIIKFKDKDRSFIVEPSIKDIDNILSRFKEDMHCGLVLLNTKNNFNAIYDNWEKIIKFRFLCIYFINPLSQLEKKWIIFPHTHDSICDRSSLKTGLKSLFETVDILNENEIEAKFK